MLALAEVCLNLMSWYVFGSWFFSDVIKCLGAWEKLREWLTVVLPPWSGSIASLGYADAKSRAWGNAQRNRDRAFLKMESPQLPYLIFKVHPYHSTYQNCVPFFFLKGSLPLTAAMRSGIRRMPPARKVCAACWTVVHGGQRALRLSLRQRWITNMRLAEAPAGMAGVGSWRSLCTVSALDRTSLLLVAE